MKVTTKARGSGLLALFLGACLMMACAQPESPKPAAPPAETGSAAVAVLLGTSAGTGVASGSTQVGNAAIYGGATAVTPSVTTFTIKNTGTGTATLTGVGATLASGSQFTLSTAPASSVAAGGTTSFAVTYTPTAVGTDTVVISVANSAAANFSFTLSATATATATAVLSVSSAAGPVASAGSVDWGKVELGTATPLTLTVTNVGTANATGVAASLSGSSDYSITTNAAASLAIGASTSVVLSLNPAKTATGVRTSTLTLANSGAAFTASLTATGIVTSKVFYVSMPNTPATANANFSNGQFLLYNGYSSTSNNFFYNASAGTGYGVGYYARNAHSFLTFPTALTGDFSISATVLPLPGNVSAPSGVAIGMTTGFDQLDRYAYALMNNSAAINTTYVSGATAVTNVAASTTTAGATSVFTAGTGTMTSASGTLTSTITGTGTEMTFSRSGTTLNLGASAGTLASLDAGLVTDGTTAVGTTAVYPTLSFVRASAVVTNLVIKDSSGFVVFDSTNGGSLGTFYPASITLSSTAVDTKIGSTVAVTATATLAGYDTAGAATTATAASSNTGIATVAVTNGAAGSTVTVTGVASGSATITVTHGSDSTKTKTFTVVVTDYPAADTAYGSLTAKAYPAPGATAAYVDGELALTFDSAPTLATTGLIKIYKTSDGSEADSIALSGEIQKVPTSATTTTSINVGTQLVRVSGNTVYITPHFGKLAYGTGYYVAIPSGTITGTLGGAAFAGLSNAQTVATWNFTTRAAPTLTSTITVNGATTNTTSDFRSLGGALHYLAVNPVANATAVTINVAAGTYTELVQYRPATANLGLTITIKGPAGNTKGDTCVVQYTNGGTMNATQNLRASFYFAGANLVLQNLTLKNTGVRATVAQAEALYFDSRVGSTLAAANCSFISKQDTVNTTGRNWFYNCFIEGNVDFIWGTADAALFENCALQVVYDGTTNTASNPYSLLVARTNGLNANNTYATSISGFTGTVGKGYVLKGSTVAVQSPSFITLGRNAGAGQYYDQVAVIDTVFSTDATGTGVIDSTGTNYLWSSTTAPSKLGTSNYVGWKFIGNSGLNLAALTNDVSAVASNTIANQAAEYATRDQILNRAITVAAGVPTGYQATTLANWDVSALATAFGAP